MIDGGERRDALLRAAREAIEEHGATVGMAQIAERAGIPRPNVYRTFPSKEHLDREVARSASKELLSHVRPELKRGERPDVIRAMIAAQLTWADQHPHLYRFVTAQRQALGLQADASDRTARPQFLSEIVSALSDHLQDTLGRPDVSPPDRVLAGAMGMVDASTLWWLDHRDETQDEAVDRIARQVQLLLTDMLTSLGVDPDRLRTSEIS